jgi:hypothetical protein
MVLQYLLAIDCLEQCINVPKHVNVCCSCCWGCWCPHLLPVLALSWHFFRIFLNMTRPRFSRVQPSLDDRIFPTQPGVAAVYSVSTYPAPHAHIPTAPQTHTLIPHTLVVNLTSIPQPHLTGLTHSLFSSDIKSRKQTPGVCLCIILRMCNVWKKLMGDHFSNWPQPAAGKIWLSPLQHSDS